MSDRPTRLEHDLLGEKAVPADAYYGVQTARGLENFHISGVQLQLYPDLIKALAMVKCAAARANFDCGQFDQAIHEPWKKPPFDLLQTSPRQVQPADSIHDSVKERWRKFAAYRPVAMAAWAQKNVA